MAVRPRAPRRVPMIDLGRAHRALEDELQAAFTRVVRSGRFILGDEVDAFEREAAAFLGVEHAIGMSSGTDALLAALLALDLGPRDEVLCPAITSGSSKGWMKAIPVSRTSLSQRACASA